MSSSGSNSSSMSSRVSASATSDTTYHVRGACRSFCPAPPPAARTWACSTRPSGPRARSRGPGQPARKSCNDTQKRGNTRRSQKGPGKTEAPRLSASSFEESEHAITESLNLNREISGDKTALYIVAKFHTRKLWGRLHSQASTPNHSEELA